MENGRLRFGILFTVILSYINLTAAQITNPYEEYGGMFPYLAELYGISNPLSPTFLGYLAFFVMMTVIYYIGLEAAIRRTNSEYLMTAAGISDGRTGTKRSRRLYGLSLAMVLTVFALGPGVVVGTVVSAASFVNLSFMAFGVIGILLMGVGLLSALGIVGQTGAGAYEGLQDARARVNEARNYTGDARRELDDAGDTRNDAEARDAADELEMAIQDIEEALEDIRIIDEKDESEIRDIINRAQAVKAGSGLGPEKDFENRLQNVDQALQIILGPASTGADAGTIVGQINAGTTYSDFTDFEDDIREIYEDLEAFADAESNNLSTMETELEELIDVVKDFEAIKTLLSELSSEIKEARKADNFEEELAEQFGDEDLYDEAEVEKRQIRQLGDELDELEELNENLESDIEDAIELFKEQLDFDESELEELERIRNTLLPDIRTNLEDCINAIESSGTIDPSAPSSGAATELWNALQAIDPDRIEDLMIQIEERMRGADGTLRGRLNDILDRFP